MANTPTKPNNYVYISNAELELEGQSEIGTPIFTFEANETAELKGSHNAAMPLHDGTSASMHWSPGSSVAQGLPSLVRDEMKAAIVHTPPGGNPVGSNETMLGLELGKRTYFKAPGAVASGLSSTALGPPVTRKYRPTGQTPGCQVEGCKNDLNSAKEYHRRHKVCPAHSKTPRVIVRGEEQRFCQQCSRFHGLDAFDEGKRSCRNRLEGHNKRRRKPQPDPLGLSTRFLPPFQDSSRLSQLFGERSTFLPQMRIPGVSPIWGDGSPSHQQKGSWQQRLLTFEDQSTYEGSIPAGTGIERQLFTGLHHHPTDRSTLFSPQSPKGMISGASDAVSGLKTHQYFQTSVNPLGASLSLTSSSGAGVLSGLEAIPLVQGFPRVSDSGCALSLQSTMQFLSSTQGMVADMATHSNMISDQGLQSSHIPTAQPLVQVVEQHHHHPSEWTHDKMLHAPSCLQSLSPTTTSYQTGSMPMDKDQLEGSFAHSLNGVTGFDCAPMYSMFHGEVKMGDLSQDVKPTMDLMHVVTSTSHGLNNQPLVTTGSFDLGISHFQDLQNLRSYEASMDGSQGI